MPKKLKESELAKHFIDYYSDAHEIFCEVPAYSIIDFVARTGNITIGVEVKTTMNFKVIEQAYNNIAFFNYVYVAVPHKIHDFSLRICQEFGIGVLFYGFGKVIEVVRPKLNRKPFKPKLLDYMKTSVAGSQNDRMTAFKWSIKQIVEVLRRKDGQKIEHVLEAIKHHWSNNTSARSCIYQWCRKGVITEFRLENGSVYLNR